MGMGTHQDEHDGLPSSHPTCVAHFGLHPGACTVVEQPSLSGRRARCAYYGAQTSRRNECNDCTVICDHEVDSSTDLAFFESKPDEPFDQFYCGCHSWD